MKPPIWTQPPPPPRQRALGREEIVAAGILVADEGGPDSITMKNVAEQLGPYSPMALYRYVHSKEGLIDLMLDAAAGEVPVPEAPSGNWREDLHTLAADTREMVLTHPWYAELTHTRAPVGPNTMRRLEFMLTVLTEQGAALGDAMSYAALIDRHIIGSGLQEAEESRTHLALGLHDGHALVAALAPIRELAEAGGHRLLTRWLSEPITSPEDQFELGLGFLLDGIAARLRG
ncbi:TetR/AcrR family transcriptional regulator C-terminal domain-containing protein [Labedaea rhizosphaerae]|uniref:TetR family transcriptional regulator n=1 Tax=Labedaea rhizosphaerae TaxID=598644 RepID=A0A4R6S5Z6_LABRH|nr:TetR/AcrR family transcriptional regulator C-terminal domain-containing protein [Labedaea rhizosphaerae]TDP95202.1 TetR family transcriptional regulator [Labedaea rhizosphaerae]